MINRSSIDSHIIVMTYIDEEEELLIDNSIDSIRNGNAIEPILERGNKTFKINLRNIYCYGTIDFNSEKDIKQIENFKFLDGLGGIGIQTPSNYNYSNHTCISPIKKHLWVETWNPLKLVLYAHGALNKPGRIILFKHKL